MVWLGDKLRTGEASSLMINYLLISPVCYPKLLQRQAARCLSTYLILSCPRGFLAVSDTNVSYTIILLTHISGT